MFVVTRIANGAICLFALILSVTFLLGYEESLGRDQAVWMGSGLGMVASVFLFDLIFRKRDRKSDLWFSVVWTLMFAYASYVGLDMVFVDTTPQQFGRWLRFTIAISIFQVLPFLLNAIYLGLLLFPKRVAT